MQLVVSQSDVNSKTIEQFVNGWVDHSLDDHLLVVVWIRKRYLRVHSLVELRMT